MFRSTIRINTDKTFLMVGGASLSSWAILFEWTNSPYSAFLGHNELAEVTTPSQFLVLASVFLVGWTLMIFAMMLPSALSFMRQFRNTIRQRKKENLLAFVLAGYVFSWAIFGTAIYVFDLGIHTLAEASLLQGDTWVFAISTFAVAALYELTSTKGDFLQDCCYPSEFIQSHWKIESEKHGAFRLGISYGKATMGDDWALLLLMFGLGLGNILVMMIFGIAMAAEKHPLLSTKVRYFLGAILLGLALYLGILRIM